VTLLSEILARRWKLPRAQTHAVVCERDLRVEMDDGAVLLADRWVAEATREQPQPTVLIRSCYGRRGFFGVLHGRILSERGLQVVIQSVRGTFGSEGTFNPFDERADGLATLRWLRRQRWHAGPIGMTGESYLGLVQWPPMPATTSRGCRSRAAPRSSTARASPAAPCHWRPRPSGWR
jgi:predicted acyl esterase